MNKSKYIEVTDKELIVFLVASGHEIKHIKERLQNTYIENLNFEEVLRKYDKIGTFFFCDPPYYETTGYAEEFGETKQKKLCSILRSIKGKFLLTINDHPNVREWYEGFNFKEVQVQYSISRAAEGRKEFRELIITNY